MTVSDLRPGALVISLDFELAWGMRNKPEGIARYSDNLHGARAVVPRLLALFEEFEVAATWAVVGFLFARSREELRSFIPDIRPTYLDERLSPYGETLGNDERDDPLHYAPTLISRIRDTPRQEIASHTFSHYCCGEAGQTGDTFRADLAAAREIAARSGIDIRSIVFPRNQHNPEYDPILATSGIRAFRGNPPSSTWSFGNSKESDRYRKRAGRLIGRYFGGVESEVVSWSEIPQQSGLSDVRSSCFVAPYQPLLKHLESRRRARMRKRVRFAARTGQILHLWWHPHNFGVHQDENLSFLRAILEEFTNCRARYQMESHSMATVDERVREMTIETSPRNGGSEARTTGSDVRHG